MGQVVACCLAGICRGGRSRAGGRMRAAEAAAEASRAGKVLAGHRARLRRSHLPGPTGSHRPAPAQAAWPGVSHTVLPVLGRSHLPVGDRQPGFLHVSVTLVLSEWVELLGPLPMFTATHQGLDSQKAAWQAMSAGGFTAVQDSP